MSSEVFASRVKGYQRSESRSLMVQALGTYSLRPFKTVERSGRGVGMMEEDASLKDVDKAQTCRPNRTFSALAKIPRCYIMSLSIAI